MMNYDSSNRIANTVQTLPNGFSTNITYTYDSYGNRTSIGTPWGSFSYQYDQLNRLKTIFNPQGKSFNFNYDSLSHRTKLTYPNGIEATYIYDAASQVKQILHKRTVDMTAIAFADYTYNNAGNRITRIDMSGIHIYEYDDLDRLISTNHPGISKVKIKNEIFTYDAVGNRLSDAHGLGYTHDNANKLLSDAMFTYAYDANRNLISKTSKISGDKTKYTYDSENQLIQVNLPDSTIVTFKYDDFGRRVEKNVEGSIQRYIYDDANILAILDDTNSPIAVFTHGTGIDEPLLMYKADTTEVTMHADGLGSIISHSNSDGNLIEKIEYESYGTPIFVDMRSPALSTSSVSFTGSPYAFTSREWDAKTSMYFYRARYYDHKIGRFITKDPIGFNGGDMNLFNYSYNNPVNSIDPYGLKPPDIFPPWVDVIENIKEAKNMGKFLGRYEFYLAVRKGGMWDYKQFSLKKYEQFGNYHFGLVGKAYGWSDAFILRGAGAYQTFRSKKGPGFFFWKSPYGDEIEDQFWINEGIKDYKSGAYKLYFKCKKKGKNKE